MFNLFLNEKKGKPGLKYLAEAITVLYDLDRDELENTISFLKNYFRTIQIVAVRDKEKLLDQNDTDINIFSTHLSLDKEIISHQKLSHWAEENNLKQANPYNKIARLFDDKYLFYILMTANEIRQPYTTTLIRNTKTYVKEEDSQLKACNELIIKPRKGTEGLDYAEIDYQKLSALYLDGLNFEELETIHKYDDAIVQEKIEIQNEFKVLYLNDVLFMNKEAPNSSLEQRITELAHEFIDTVEEYARYNKCQKPEIFSMDIILSTDDELFLLEANIRPGALYRYTNVIVSTM